MRIDRPEQKIYVRQSWLNDMAICPERARYGQIRPDFRIGSDATILGTALHTGIESVLKHGSDYAQMLEIATVAHEQLSQEPHQVTNIDAELVPTYLESMTSAFYEGILPHVQLGGMVEQKFAVPLRSSVNGFGIWIEGTMDYVTPDGVVWDWKTASRAYNLKDKQKSSIQASVYAEACVANGWSPHYPVDFRYGVMVRNHKPKAQVVSLVRTENHAMWLRQFVKGAVSTALNTGYENNWFMNDSSNLCSSKWCSYWSICKGAFLRDEDNELAEQID